MLDTVAALPKLLALSRFVGVAVFVPELDGDFVGGEGEELFPVGVGGVSDGGGEGGLAKKWGVDMKEVGDGCEGDQGWV